MYTHVLFNLTIMLNITKNDNVNTSLSKKGLAELAS